MRTGITLVLLLLGCSLQAAQAPAPANRVLRLMDFEERCLGNSEELPMHWIKLVGPAMPHYINARLATDRSRSGNHSFKFNLNGGSLAYRYEPKLLKVQQGATYRVETYVHTTVLPNARARLTAYFIDLDERPVLASMHHSPLYAAEHENDSWKHLSIELTAEHKEDVYLVVELELLQPMLYAPNRLGNRTLYPQDIRGSAWFDDLTVSQVPKLLLSTDLPGNIFRRGQPLQLRVQISDRFTDDLATQLIVRDADGKSVYQRSGALDNVIAEQISANQKRMLLTLPQLPAGWYQASLEMSTQGKPIGGESLDLVCLADDAIAAMPDKRFGIIATHLPFEGWNELPQLLPYLSAGRVKLAVWNASGDVQQFDPAGFDRLLVQLGDLGITPTACLVDLPPSIARKIGGNSWPRLLSAKVEDWQPQLSYLVSRHANHLDRWQLGADGSEAFVTQPQMRQVYQMLYKQFSKLAMNPDLAMPWPAWYDMDKQMPATVALSVPPSVLPAQLPLYIQELRGHPGHNLSLSLQMLDGNRYGRQVQIRDLAQRVIYALAGGAERIDFPLPFTVERREDRLVKQPRESLLIIRTLVTLLGGATYKGKVPLAEGVEAFLFDKNGQGILVLWDRGGQGGIKQLAMNLGDRPLRVDLWGNMTPLLHAADPKLKDKVDIEVGTMPVFLVDIDGYQAQFRASVAIDRPLLESSFKSHSRRLRFTNPYPQAVSGLVHLKAPAGWTINPPTFNFNLNPGETFDRAISIEFPYNSFAGNKSIDADFLLQANRNSTFNVPLTLKLGLSDVGMQTMALRDGKDIVVQQMITNYGNQPIDYTAFALYPGQSRQERLVTNLAPGKTTVKRYRFTDAEFGKNRKVRLGLREISGTRILNEEAEIQ